MAFLHFKNGTKICKINEMAKKTLSSGENARFRGVIWSIKVVSDFHLGDRKYYSQNRKITPILQFSGSHLIMDKLPVVSDANRFSSSVNVGI